VAGAEARALGDEPQITDFNDFEIRIEEVFRFNPEDTLVFHVTLRNKSEREIRYLPESFCVRVGNRLYYQSVSDAPGLLPPHAASMVYFAITGTPDGGRNELSLKNEFSVLVSRLPSPRPSPATTQTTSTPPQTAAAPQQPSSPSVQALPQTGMTPEQEALARQTLRRVIADLDNTNAPSAKQTRP
jgi:hypothetical protein